MYQSSFSADLTFSAAAKIFLELKDLDSIPGALPSRYVRENTVKGYKRHIASLNLFFEHAELGKIHLGNLRAYQAARFHGAQPFIRKRRPHDKEARPCPCKPAQINQELCFLRSLMKRAKCWSDELKEYYEEIPEAESEVPRALTPEQQQMWIDVSRMQERWSVVHWYSIIAFDTLMSTNELRGLRIGDINLHHRQIDVPWPCSKNKHRHRPVSIDNADVLWAFDRLLGRAHDLGAKDPQHYLFPFRPNKQTVLVDRPMSGSGLKKAWQEVREASGLLWFRPYDTRHTGITRQAEAGVPMQVVMARAGHIDERMTRHYTHIAMGVQRQWSKYATADGPRPQYAPQQGPLFPPARVLEMRRPAQREQVIIRGRVFEAVSEGGY
jgi:integrase